jgi:hypothetical protein
LDEPGDMTTQTTDHLIGLIGDAHGNSWFAERAIKELAARGVRQHHFLGDFGFVWNGASTEDHSLKRVRVALERANSQAFVTGGNHEGYKRLLAIEEDSDGLRWIRKDRIALLPRGWRALSPEGRVIASLGGANSIDRYQRQKDKSWWSEEQITESDLDALGTEPVDILLGHDAPITQTLQSKLIPNEHFWDPRGLAYAHIGQQMFHRGVLNVEPALTVSGHYHVFVDTAEEFTGSAGDPFTLRSVVLNVEGALPSAAVLNTDTLELEFVDLGSGR